MQIHVWINEEVDPEQRTVEVYESEGHLAAELHADVAAGLRCFVVSNSKTKVEKLEAALTKQFGMTRQVALITSSTITSDAAQEFLSDVSRKVQEYDVILTSPSVGTGVDISLPDNSRLVDRVYGLFEAQITNHFEVDQQLARVRNPGAEMVWISPRRFHYETNLDVVQHEIMRKSSFKNVLTGYASDGTPEYDCDDEFIKMACEIVAVDRASKNALRKNFIELKKRQGYRVEIVAPDEEKSAVGKALLEAGKSITDERAKEALLAASLLSKPEFDDVREALQSGDAVPEDDLWCYGRTRIELFYREPVTAELIAGDRRGRYRKAVTLFEDISELQYRYLISPPGLLPRSRVIKGGEEDALAMLHLLQRTRIYRDGRLDHSVIVQAGDLSDFVAFCREKKAEIETLLGIEVRSDLEAKPVQQLGAVLKLVGLRLIGAGTQKKTGQKTYKYQLDREALARLSKTVETRKQSRGWESLYERNGWDVKELVEEEPDW